MYKMPVVFRCVNQKSDPIGFTAGCLLARCSAALDQSPIDEALCCVLFMAMEAVKSAEGDENGKVQW